MDTIERIYRILQSHRPNFKDIPINAAVIPCMCGARLQLEGNEFPGDAHRRHLASVLAEVVHGN